MQFLHRLTMAITIIVAGANLASCKSEEQIQEEAMWHMDTPLPHDPMDKDVLAQWWSNGNQLLRLQSNHYYLLYDSNSRYDRARERGRWDQDGYALLWLDPYNTLQTESTRASITKIDGRLAIIVPGLEPMFALEGPPATREDQLVGSWKGAMGSLQLNANMTYSLSSTPGATVDGQPLVGHSGRWKLNRGEIALTPTTPSVMPMVLKVREAAPAPAGGGSNATQPEQVDPVIEGLGYELQKVRPTSA
jgi:hypothetical protein